MKNKICLAALVLALALLPSCQRNETPDQPWDPNAGFEYFIEGVAIPSTIYLPEFTSTSIKVKVSRNDGTPVVGIEVILSHYSGLGVFDTGTSNLGRYTNANGEVWATFIVTAAVTTETYIEARLISNLRETDVTDDIPIQIISN